MALSDDEYTVLMIAANGESLMPIGRWAMPIEQLVTRGLMKRHDQFNNVITPKGRHALMEHEEKVDLGIIEACNKIANSKAQAELSIDQCVKHMVVAARATHAATGESAAESAARWAGEILRRALVELSE